MTSIDTIYQEELAKNGLCLCSGCDKPLHLPSSAESVSAIIPEVAQFYMTRPFCFRCLDGLMAELDKLEAPHWTEEEIAVLTAAHEEGRFPSWIS
jgi:hypothetical protein